MTKRTNMGKLFRWVICIGILLVVLFWRIHKPAQLREVHQAVFGFEAEEIMEVFGASNPD